MSEKDDLDRDIREEDELRGLLRTSERTSIPPFASVAARARRRSVPLGAIAAVAAAVLITAVVTVVAPLATPGAPPSASPASSSSPGTAASPSVSPSASGTPASTATGAALLKPGFGVIYQGVRSGWDPGSAQQIRREGDTDRSVGELAGSFFNQFHGAVTPDGRRAVYPAQDLGGPWVLYLLDGAKPTEQKRLLTLPDEIPGSLIWSSDMTGIAFTAQDSGATQGVTPKYDSIRTLDLATGVVRELARITDGSNYQIVGWDRSTGTLAAAVVPYPSPASRGSDVSKTGSYIVIGPSGTKNVPLDGPSPALSSADARVVYGLRCDGNPASCSLWTWPLADYGARVDRQVASGLSLAIFGARPGSDEIGLTVYSGSGASIEGQIALWSPSSGLRTVYRFPQGRSPGSRPFFRADGTGIFLELGIDENVVVDLPSGATTPLPGATSSGRIEASIRLD